MKTLAINFHLRIHDSEPPQQARRDARFSDCLLNQFSLMYPIQEHLHSSPVSTLIQYNEVYSRLHWQRCTHNNEQSVPRNYNSATFQVNIFMYARREHWAKLVQGGSRGSVDKCTHLCGWLLASCQRYVSPSSAGYQRPVGLNIGSENLFSSVIKLYYRIKYPTKRSLHIKIIDTFPNLNEI